MTETELKALRERLGLADDADASAINAKLDELEEAATAPTGDEVTDEQAIAALAKATGIDADKVKAAVDGAKSGKVTVSETLFEELKANAKLGAEARAKQLEAERDEAIATAFAEGKISADRRDAWRTAWDKDPEGTKADLASLDVRFPVAKPSGYAGHDGSAGDGVKDMTDDEAEALAQLAGTTKEALLA